MECDQNVQRPIVLDAAGDLPASIRVEDEPRMKLVNCFARDEECPEVGL